MEPVRQLLAKDNTDQNMHYLDQVWENQEQNDKSEKHEYGHPKRRSKNELECSIFDQDIRTKTDNQSAH
jgi:hypothetical protein